MVDGTEIDVALASPVTLRSGHSTGRLSTHHDHSTGCGLLIRNLTDQLLNFPVGPWLVGDVIDPETGAIVGGCSDPIPMIRAGFSVPPGGTTRYAMQVCTESFEPDLGYAIPPGEWGIQTTLNRLAPGDHLGTGDPLRTPILPLTVIP